MKVIFEGDVATVRRQMEQWLGEPVVTGVGTHPILVPPAEPDAPAPAKRKPGRPRKTPEPEPTPEPEAPKAGSRRRGVRAKAEEPAPPASEGELTDEDVTKAASLAAETLMPKGVTEILTQFGTGDLKALDQGQRREFCDLLTMAVGREKRGE
tara:strand:- start:9696 stop:10154 length:459 start_codon:yes stop_codon:yes gene_type:complete